MTTIDPAPYDFDFILFGGAGDLSTQKLIPALFKNDQAGFFAPAARIICVGRQAWTQEQFLEKICRYTQTTFEHTPHHVAQWQTFIQRLHYLYFDAADLNGYAVLNAFLRTDPTVLRIFYLATPPDLFEPICHNLGTAQLATPHSRIVLEKPLGRDLLSAQRINAELGRVFSEHQIFRIDHYLGKETVQNLLALRFGNILFEPLWRREWISDVQITIAEDAGVGTRMGYYDTAGALRDMLQNHLLQLLCIIAMEPPVAITADAVRDEKLQVLRSLKPFTPDTLAHNIVRGQYAQGYIDGTLVPGYQEEPNASPHSQTESFIALKAEINAWRWAGVPFYLRTGKRMPHRLAEIVIRFKPIPYSIFNTNADPIEPNCLIIQLQPDESLTLKLMAKTPGDAMQLRPVKLAMDFNETFKKPRMTAYQRLLLDVLRGQLTLFMRGDELEAAWMWVEPILNYWKQNKTDPLPYPAGTWGPAAANTLIQRDQGVWREDMIL